MKITTIKCKKCKKEIPTNSKFCCWCGKPVEQKSQKRADGRYEKSITVNGKRKTFYGKTKAELNKKILLYQEDKTESEKFNNLLERYKDEYLPTLAPSTQSGYTHALKVLEEFFDDYMVSDIKIVDIQRCINNMSRSYTAKTLKNHLAVFSSVFSFGIRCGVYGIETNPCNYVVVSGRKSTKRRIATDEEIKIICNSVNKKFGLFAIFVLLTGCRRGEALAIKYEDIDRDNNVLHIDKSLSWKYNKPFIKPPKTDTSIRDIYVPEQLLSFIPIKKIGYLFTDSQNKLLTESHYKKIWDSYCEDVGLKQYADSHNIPVISAHCLRHNYATLLNESGIDVTQAKRLLGHANEATTKDIYTDITERREKSNNIKLMHRIDEEISQFMNS